MALKAYKYRIYPNVEQQILLAKHFGVVRYLYNKALSMKDEEYRRNQKTLSIYEISGQVTQWKKNEETSWLKEVNSQSIQMSLKHLDVAFTNFFKKRADFPKFKSKKDKQTFSCPQNCSVNFDSSRFYCPKFKGGIKAVFHRTFQGEVKTCTISKTKTGRYFVAILVDDGMSEKPQSKAQIEKCLGIDLGIKDFVICSDGAKFENPKFLRKKQKRLRREQRKHSRKKKGGSNREKQRKRLARQHEKAANARKDYLHKVSHSIAENQSYTSVAVEDLNVKGMMKNHKLAGSIGDCGWGMFKTFLEYKLKDRGKSMIEIGRFQPSSKKCGCCGYINQELTLKDRKWTCPNCGTRHDRDINAANNIKTYAFCEQDAGSKKLDEFSVRPERSERGNESFQTPVETKVARSLKQEALSLAAG